MNEPLAAIKFNRMWAPEAMKTGEARVLHYTDLRTAEGVVARGRGAVHSSETGGYTHTVLSAGVFTRRDGTVLLLAHDTNGDLTSVAEPAPLDLDGDY